MAGSHAPAELLVLAGALNRKDRGGVAAARNVKGQHLAELVDGLRALADLERRRANKKLGSRGAGAGREQGKSRARVRAGAGRDQEEQGQK